MRLAVETEDHPLEYRDFEGTIPKGQYGGGEVWIFARGRYEITQEKKDGFHFRLHSEEISAEFRMHRTREGMAARPRGRASRSTRLRDPIGVMLAQSAVDAACSGRLSLRGEMGRRPCSHRSQ
ncbi:MAG: hypothetical protein MZW92_06760 [Comamonadaceae bacterium]|nr:hypothetical protein [Comamonadaceae bacterium]